VLIVVVYVLVLDVVKVWYYKVMRKERAAGEPLSHDAA
jgi:hypothetical protein